MKNKLSKWSPIVTLLIFFVGLMVYPSIRYGEIPVRNWYLIGVVLILTVISLFYTKRKHTGNPGSFIFSLLAVGLTILFLAILYYYYQVKTI